MNRIATDSDILLYGSYIKPGKDAIFDTPTKILADGTRELTYYFMDGTAGGTKDFLKDLRNESVFWFDGDKLGYCAIKFQNTVDELPWFLDKITFKNIPGTRVRMKSFSVRGAENVIINGEDKIFTGLKEWKSQRKYMSGWFGWHLIQPMDAKGQLGYNISVQDHGSIYMTGVEAQHGFCCERTQSNQGKITVDSFTLTNFYFHDTVTGEGIYAGNTKAAPIPKFRDSFINNGVIARTAAEPLQLQHFMESEVSNITMYACDTAWLEGFQNFQDRGIQLKMGGGYTKLNNIIVDGYGSVGFMPSSVEASDFERLTDNIVKIKNVLFYDGRGTLMYCDKNMVNGTEWILDNVVAGGFNDTYYGRTGNKKPSYIIASGAKTDRVVIRKLIVDDTVKDPIFDKPTTVSNYILETKESIVRSQINPPIYVNSGFKEKPSKIMQWRSVYAHYFTGADNIPVHWDLDTIAIYVNLESNTYEFYKVVTEHNTVIPTEVGAKILTPDQDSINFMKLTWDLNGIRNDHPDWQSTDRQSNLPPDNLKQINLDYAGWGAYIPIREEIVEEYYLAGRRVTKTDLGNQY